MTKVKDLVTVLVDRVFVETPIDDERYELIVAMGYRWHSRWAGLSDILPSGNIDINHTIDVIEGIFQKGANAWAELQACPSYREPQKITKVRAQRVAASLDEEDLMMARSKRTREEVASCLVTQLWGALYERLLVVHAYSTQFNSETKESK